MTTAASFEDFLTALPKVELHVHLEGSMQPVTLLALANKHQISDLQRSLAEIRSWYEFRDPRYDFQHVLDRLANGDDPRSPLARTVGAKGYHSTPTGIYTVR